MTEAAKTTDEAQKPKGKTAMISAAHGDLVHLFTGKKFTQGSAIKHELDAWTQCQLDAGVLVIAD